MAKQHRNMISLLLAVCMLLSLVWTGIPVAAEEAAPSQTRDYDEAFDRMLDAVAGSNDAELAYRASAWEAGKCDDIEDPIYKIASPKISAGFDQLILELRSPDGSIKLKDLTLGIRISDAVPVKPYALDHADISGGITLSEGEDIGANWVTVAIDFAQTEVGIESSNPDAMVGFHLYANAVAGKLDIRKIAVSKGGSETVVKQFDGADYGNWWDGGEADTFRIVPPNYAITAAKQIASEVASSNNTDGKYSAIALGIFGSGDVKVAPVLADGSVGAAKAWSELKDLEGNALSAIDENDKNVVIALESLGAKEIRGVELSVSGGTVYISRAFFTNMETVVPQLNFPVLDMSTVDYMTQFDYEYLTAGADYDKAVTECAEFGMNYILSYSGKNNVITNGHLVLDAKGEDYTGIKLRSTVASAGRQYLVIKYRLEGRSDLTNFRFDVLSTATDTGYAVKYPHEWYADTALLSTSNLNPYAGDQYSYLVIDIAKTWGAADISGVDMYISGEGQILIDEIFYADAVGTSLQYTNEALAEDFGGKNFTAAGPGYAYVGYIDGSVGKGHRYMELTVEGDISQLRFEMVGSGVFWASENAEGTLLDKNGNKLSQLTGAQTVLIDLVASGVNIGALDAIYVHNNFAAAGDVLKISSIRFAKELPPELDWSAEALAADFPGRELTAGGPGYAHVGWIDGSAGKGYRYMQLEVEGDISLLRIEMAGGVFWAKENAQGTLKDYSGQNLAVHNGKQTLVIDLLATGVDINKLADIHIHNEFAAAGDVLKISSMKFANERVNEITWGDEALADDFPGKEVTATVADYAYIGWINGSVGAGKRYMMLTVEGDISQLRIEMGGGTFWVTENAQGTLKNIYGRPIANTSGAQTLIIDLEATGVGYAALADIHIHNNFAAVGDVLKVSSIKFGNVKIDLTENDDAKPVIDWTLIPDVKVGDEVALSAAASDNYTAADKVTLSFEVMLDGKAVEVKDGKFVAAAGTYTIKLTAVDEAGNEAVETKTLTVKADIPDVPKPTDPQPTDSKPTDSKPTTTPTEPITPEKPDDGGISPIVIAVIVVVVLGAAVAAVLVMKKKK